MPSASASILSAALSLAVSTDQSVQAFTSLPITQNAFHIQPPSQLSYRSIHHGPDVEPLTEEEKLGADFTKMDKKLIKNFGPGMFDGFADINDQFDGGDSEMGLTGDGTIGLRKFGRDVTPHLARTSTAKTFNDEAMDELIVTQRMSYAEELLHSTPSMDEVRAQQLENWAEQREISSTNKYMYDTRLSQSHYDVNHIESHEEDSSLFQHPVEAGDDYEGMITLRAPLNGVARYDIMLKNGYMGFAKFRAAFVGYATNNWQVTPSDGVLKQHEDTHFAVTFRPSHPGISTGYLVIETQDFKKTWKVVGSTGDQYEF